MLDSVKISRRQSEIRQELAALVGKDSPTDDETRSMETLDSEYRTNETRYRAALVSEDEERQEATDDLETRSDREWSDMVDQFELRQVALALDEGRQLDGQTAEIVQEMRSQGGYRGIPVPLMALERRAGETVAAGTPDPITTRPIIERLFPSSVASAMGGQMINIGVGETEWPVTTSAVTAGWAATETGAVAGPAEYTTLDRPLAPDHNLGIQMKITRKTMKQSGAALEQAVRRDMNGAIQQELDRAIFLGSGATGEPTGLFTGAAGFGITETPIDAAPTWAVFRSAVTRFITGNAANGPGSVRLLLRPEVWDTMDGAIWDAGSGITEWDRLAKAMGSVTLTNNALAAPAGGPPVTTNAMLTTTAGGVAPYFVGIWGGVDMVRDPYSDAASGGLRLTALMTMDLTISRAVQTEILTGLE
ncbi:MAG: phage major capsid protein [Rhodobacteraceae bacterium]|nr:phage major capsid protein [Paracoccaceae bacterium]